MKILKGFGRPFAVALALFICSPTLSSAQAWRSIVKKIEQEANKRIEKKVDKAIDKGFDKVEETADAAVKSNSAEAKSQRGFDPASLEKLMGANVGAMLGSNVKLKDEYNFRLGVRYRSYIEFEGEIEENPATTMWFSDGSLFGTEVADDGFSVMSVMDEDAMVMFREQDKSYFAIDMAVMRAFIKGAADQMANDPDIAAELQKEYKIVKKGTEKIAGYNCQIYEVEDEYSRSRVWMTEDLEVNMMKLLGGLSSDIMGKMNLTIPQGDFSGMMMKSETFDKETNELIVMEAQEILKSGKTLRTSEYKSSVK